MSDVQKELEKIDANAERDNLLNGLLQIPVVAEANCSAAAEKQQGLDNNVRMEDRATLRISSQHIATGCTTVL